MKTDMSEGGLARSLAQNDAEDERAERAYQFRDYIYDQLALAANDVTDCRFTSDGIEKLKVKLRIVFDDVLDKCK